MSDITRRALFGRGAPQEQVRLAQAAPARAAPRPRSPGRTLVKNCDAVITMDAARRDVLGGDVLIVGDRIAAVGKGLSAADAEVVDGRGAFLSPGMIDGYRQTWQSLLVGAYVDTAPGRAARRAAFAATARRLTAADLRLGAQIGGLSAIDAGVTTLIDHPTAADTPAKAEAAVLGLKDSGVAGVVCCPLSAADLAARHLADPAGALRFGVAVDGAADGGIGPGIARARALQPALIVLRPDDLRALARAGLLGPDLHFVHGGALTDADLRLMAAAGSTLAATCMEDFVAPHPAAHGRARRAGVAAGVGVGSPVAYTLDPFEQVRAAFFSLFRTQEGFAIAAPYKAADTFSYVTSEGARAIGQQQQIGSIEVGKRADLVLTSTKRFGFAMIGEPVDRLINFAAQDDIDSVWVAGVARKRGGAMVGIDWRSLKAQMGAVQARLFAA